MIMLSKNVLTTPLGETYHKVYSGLTRHLQPSHCLPMVGSVAYFICLLLMGWVSLSQFVHLFCPSSGA